MVLLLELTHNETKNDAVKRVKNFLGPAIDSLQGDWRDPIGDRDWQKLSEKHISGCYSLTCRFDKATVAVVALEKALERPFPNLDIYEHVRIAPAIYVVDGFDSGLIQHIKRQESRAPSRGTIFSEMAKQSAWPITASLDEVEDLENRYGAFMTELKDGYPITLQGANEIVSFLQGYKLADNLKVRRLNSRIDGVKTKYKRPNPYEFARFNWEPLRSVLPESVKERIPYFRTAPAAR